MVSDIIGYTYFANERWGNYVLNTVASIRMRWFQNRYVYEIVIPLKGGTEEVIITASYFHEDLMFDTYEAAHKALLCDVLADA